MNEYIKARRNEMAMQILELASKFFVLGDDAVSDALYLAKKIFDEAPEPSDRFVTGDGRPLEEGCLVDARQQLRIISADTPARLEVKLRDAVAEGYKPYGEYGDVFIHAHEHCWIYVMVMELADRP